MHPKPHMKLIFGSCAAAGVAAVLAGCASTAPLPMDKFELASSAIRRADQAGAAQWDPTELQDARQKLQLAQNSPRTEDGAIQASRLATEAELDAHLAEANAHTAQAEKAAHAVDRSTVIVPAVPVVPATPPPAANP